MSAELVDPFATPEQPMLTPEEWVAIRDEINERKFDDRALYPDLLAEALRTLGEIGMGNTADPAREATQCLRRLAYRAHTGVPYDEPREPAWSLDSERGLHFFRHVDDVVADL